MSASAELICIDPARVDEFWPHVEIHLGRAVERCGDWTLCDLRSALSHGALLWIAWDGTEVLAAAVTQLLVLPRGKVCNIVACGGAHMDHWRAFIADIESYARCESCIAVRAEGRRGWGRALGYDEQWTTFERRL